MSLDRFLHYEYHDAHGISATSCPVSRIADREEAGSVFLSVSTWPVLAGTARRGIAGVCPPSLATYLPADVLYRASTGTRLLRTGRSVIVASSSQFENRQRTHRLLHLLFPTP